MWPDWRKISLDSMNSCLFTVCTCQSLQTSPQREMGGEDRSRVRKQVSLPRDLR